VVKATRGQTRTPSQAKASDPGWAKGLRVQVGGSGVVAHAGVVVPRLLGDRVGLTAGLGQVLTRAGFTPGRDRGQVLADGMCALAAGATCASDVTGPDPRAGDLRSGRGRVGHHVRVLPGRATHPHKAYQFA
jgi:hypothetical protein